MTDTATLRPTTAERSRSHSWALPVLMAVPVMIVLDFFVVNVALPAVQHDLHAGDTALEWVVAGYGLTFAVLLASAGRLADRFGRRRIFCLGLGIFALARLPNEMNGSTRDRRVPESIPTHQCMAAIGSSDCEVGTSPRRVRIPVVSS